MYDIKVLSDNDFFNVAKSDQRYSYVDQDNLGFADPLKNTAYVRYVAHPELQKYLVNHELEELTSDQSSHEDPNGIRHKKFFKEVLLPIVTGGLSLLPSFGGARRETPGERLPPTPLFGGDFVGGQYGGPLGQFSVPQLASGRIPEELTGGQVSGQGLTQGLQSFGQPLPPELLERTKGFLQGRVGRLQF